MQGTGYDPITRLYVVADPTFRLPPIPERPTEADARAALSRLDGLLAGYPFASDVDRSVALAGLMTAVTRSAMSTAPMIAVRASTPGTGKSHLVDMHSALATGQLCPVIAAGKGEEELEKRLGALLIEGSPVVSIDNCNGTLGGETLCLATERTLVKVRVLGQSKAPQVECRSLMLATGNGLVLREDMVRRALVCTLDAKTEQPELREFEFDPLQLVLADRGSYVADVVTILRGYRAAGSPRQKGALGSYAMWSDMVRSPLIWLGREDPVKAMDAARAEDPELCAIRDLFRHWEARIGLNEESTTHALIQVACARKPVASTDAAAFVFTDPEFRDVLLGQAGEGGAVNTKRLGRWLSRIKGRIVDGHRLDMTTQSASHGNRYTLIEVGAEAPRPETEF
jgi:hypothetical protein